MSFESIIKAEDCCSTADFELHLVIQSFKVTVDVMLIVSFILCLVFDNFHFTGPDSPVIQGSLPVGYGPSDPCSSKFS